MLPALPETRPAVAARPMITLGINAAFYDSAAVLVVDCVVIAAAEEERFTRIKHAKRPVPFSAWELPFNAIHFCLAQAGLTLAECDHVAYSFDSLRFVADPSLLDHGSISMPLLPSDPETEGPWENPWDPLFLAAIVNAPGQLADGAPHHLRRRFGRGGSQAAPRWHFVDHHTCHQASAFLAAPFSRCAVMTLDGRGEQASTTYGRYRGNRYEHFGDVLVPHSLGLLYERITTHLGFLHSSDEYKVMALAASGDARRAEPLRGAVQVRDGGQFEVEPLDLNATLGPQRGADEPLGQRHFDIAAALQEVLGRTGLALSRWLAEATGERSLAMAGGVALNCVMNSVLRDSGIFPDGVWVQPAAGDSGTALGAALWVDARERRGPGANQPSPLDDGEPEGSARTVSTLAPRRWQMHDACLGPEYTDTEIETQLTWAKLSYRRLDDMAGATAALLAENRIVGWFQGRMEYGPRALGARSILASPIDPRMQARLNELKDREDFRPVAPVVPVERLGEWFEPAGANGGNSPFMLFTYDVVAERTGQIPSACHADRSARVQTVDASTQPRFHALLEAFGRQTGVPVVINTSFNAAIAPEPEPVENLEPRDASDNAEVDPPSDAGWVHDSWLQTPGSMRDGARDSAVSATDMMVADTGLRHHLHGQENLLPLSARDHALVFAVIESLDDDGYLRTELAEIGESSGLEPAVEATELLTTLRLVQSFDPPGVGARTIAECLLLQIDGIAPELRASAKRILESEIERLAQRDVAGISRQLGLAPELV